MFIDEPTTGVDPYSRRQMREIFSCALENGVTIILTSHSMEECEILCDRLGIVSKGQFQCIGNIQDLKEKFGNGYSINIQFDLDQSEENIHRLYDYLKGHIQIEINHSTTKTILFQCNHSSPSKLFQLIQSIQQQFSIQSYTIQQTTLEDIFLSFQHQND